MATPAAVLSILVEANTSAANANLARTNAELDATKASAMATTGATSKAGSAMRKLGTAAKIGGAAIAVGFVVETKKAVTTTQDLTKSTINLHKNLGLTNKVASEWAGVAKARGADTTKLGMAFKTLATQISAAGHGSAAAWKMFHELGFTQKDVQIAMNNTEFATKKVADGLNALPGSADKATIASKLFGRGWQTIAPILRDGSAAMQDQLNTVEKYGGVLQGKTLKQQEALLANIRENKIAWQGFQVTLATAVTPALNVLSNQFQHISEVIANPKLSDAEKFQKVAGIIHKDFQTALNFILKMIPTIANGVGKEAPKVAAAFINGFIHADVWGKLALGGWLLAKFGGAGAFVAIGKKIGGWLGISMATTVATETEGTALLGGQSKWSAMGTRIGGWIGPAVAAAAVPILLVAYRKQITDWFHSRGLTLPGETVPGKAQPPLNAPTTIGGVAGGAVSGVGALFGGGGGIPNENKALKQLAMQGIKDFGSLSDAAKNWSKSTRDSFEQAALASSLPEKALHTLQQVVDGSTNISKKDLRNLADVTGLSMKQIIDASQNAKQKVSAAADQQAQNVGQSYSNMNKAVAGGLNTLQNNTNNALKALGLNKPVQFRTSAGAPTGAGGAGHPVGRAKGGDIPGSGNRDTVPAMLTPGEFVIRKEQAKKHRALLEMINNGFAKGGSVKLLPGVNMSVGQEPQILRDLGAFSNEMGKTVYVISGYRSPAHSVAVGGFANDPHTRGQAADIGLGAPTLASMYPMSLDSPLHKAGLYRPFYPPSQAEANHVQLLNAAAAGKLGPTAQKIARVLLKGPAGPLRDMGQRALDKVRGAANRFVSKQSPKFSVGSVSGAAGTLSPAEFLRVANQAIKVTHSPGFTAGGLETLAMQESGLRINPPPPHDINYAQGNPSMGLMQVTGSTFRTYHQPGTSSSIINPLANIAASINYQKARYGHQVTFSPYGMGGLVMPPYGGSFGGGGTVPGPIGAPRTIVAHGGESVGTPEVHFHFAPGTEWLRDFIQVEVDGAITGQRRFGNQMRRMTRA